jgi:hypothetical protein
MGKNASPTLPGMGSHRNLVDENPSFFKIIGIYTKICTILAIYIYILKIPMVRGGKKYV